MSSQPLKIFGVLITIAGIATVASGCSEYGHSVFWATGVSLLVLGFFLRTIATISDDIYEIKKILKDKL